MRCLFIFLLLLCGSDLFAQKNIVSSEEDRNRKDSSQLNIGTNEDYKTFRVFDSALNNSVFVIGENHHFSKHNTTFHLKLFKYLHKNAGVNTLLLESGYTRGWLVNQYVTTGDTNLLNILERYSSASHIDFYKDLRVYRKEIGDSEAIHVAGVDVERFNGLPVIVLNELLPSDRDVPDQLKITVESIKGLSAHIDYLNQPQEKENQFKRILKKTPRSSFNVDHSVAEIINSFKCHQRQFENYLGADFIVFHNIIKSLEDKVTYDEYVKYDVVQQYTFREGRVYHSFMELYEQDTTRKFMMQFDRCHAGLSEKDEACDWESFNEVVKRIDRTKRPDLQGNVSTLGVFYSNPEGFVGREGQICKTNSTLSDHSLTLFAVNSDSIIPPETSDKNQFNFIIINNLEQPEESDESKCFIERKVKGAGADDVRLHFKFNYGYFQRRTGPLNNFLENNGFTNTWHPEYTFGFGIAIEETEGYSLSWDHFILSGFNDKDEGNRFIDIGGFTTLLHFGKDLSKKQWFSFTPNIGLGYARTRLDNVRATTTAGFFMISSSGPLFFNDHPRVRYINSSFLGDVMVSAKINYKCISIGLEGGYIIGFSNPKWRSNGEIAEESPPLRYTGYFVNSTLSFFL